MEGPDIQPSYLLGLVLWLLIGVVIGYVRGRKHGRAAERREVRFTPVDKLEPREGYDPQPHYSPPLSSRRVEPVDGMDPRWQVEPRRQNSGPKLQGYTNDGDPYRYYEVKDL